MKRLWILILIIACGRPLTAEAPPAQSLAGLWSLSLSADMAWLNGQDLLSYYPSGALSAPPTQVFPGFNVGLRRHLSDRFFVGLQLSSLPKGYNVDVAGSNDTWTFDGLMLGLSGGWVWLHSAHWALYTEAEAGWLGLADGSLERTGANAGTGSLDGSALAEQFNLGVQCFILPSVALEAQGGYRVAHLPLSLSTANGRQTSPSAPEFYVDLGGPFVRLGLSFFWGLRNPWGEQAVPAAPAPPPAQGP